MDDNAPKETPPATPAENSPVDFNKIDLSQLQGFSFGTQWSVDKSSPSDARDRPRRDDRRDGPGGGGPDRRDRRTFRKPAGAPGGDAPAGGPERREFSGGGPARRDGPGGGGGEYRGGPRRDGPGGGGDYRGGPRRGYGGGYGGRGEPQDFRPYESPYFSVTFYPEDTSFSTLVQTIRKSCRTIELFEIARTVVAKTDRFVVVVSRRPQAERPAPAPAPAAPAAADAAAPVKPEPAARPAMQPIYVSLPDGLPFETEEAAVSHVVSNHLDKYFDMAEVEVDPPKGNFQVINKCGVTGELLGPPNYHRYNQIVQQHHAAKVARMPLEAFRSRIETIRDPEAVNQWLAKMKKTTRYTWKTPAPKAAAPAPAPAIETASETPAAEAPAVETPAAETPATEAPAPAPAAAVETPVVPTAPTFDAFEEARLHLLTNAREKIVRAVEHARFHGKVAETMPQGEIRRAIEGALERQRKFPLDTANALRGRLRREHFTIFKKGSKGVSYVCAVKRKFRVPGQTFADSIGGLITFIETHPMIRASELPAKLLGVNLPVPPTAPVEGAAPAAPMPELTVEERAKIVRLQGDLMWLVREGYVTEFIDGTLYAPPPVVEARKKEAEAEEHDPENFPEAPPAAEASEPSPAPAESAEAAPVPVAPVVEAPVETPAAVEPAPVAEEPKSEPPVG